MSETNKLNHTIPEIFNHLFDTYGDVTPSKLQEFQARVESLTFPPSKPVDYTFSEIDDLDVIAKIAKAPLAPTQKINMAYIHVYKSVLCKWDKQLDAHKSGTTSKSIYNFHTKL